jgi:hypothetical protein
MGDSGVLKSVMVLVNIMLTRAGGISLYASRGMFAQFRLLQKALD